jgi:bisphosphoglycerate-dependent phosphoglycerate mutase
LPEDVERVELRTGHPLIYRLNADGSIAEKRDIAA